MPRDLPGAFLQASLSNPCLKFIENAPGLYVNGAEGSPGYLQAVPPASRAWFPKPKSPTQTSQPASQTANQPAW